MHICLVTGGAGFIGSWLCEDLLKKGYKVICVDNFITGAKDNIKRLQDNENFSLIECDVSKVLKIDGKIDYIFHLASPASPIDYQNLPIETMLVNSFGTYNMLSLAMKKNARFLLASTSEVYGYPEEHPQKETYFGHVNTIGPRSCYDESKRFAEALTMSFRRIHKMDVRIARIFNTFGPKMRKNDGRVIPNFIIQTIRSEPLTVYGDGKQTRSFCYVSDMVDALEKMMFTEKLDGEVFNVGNASEISILDLAKMIRDLTKSDSEIVFKPLPGDDPARRKPDINKAKKMLGWEPKIDLKEGLRKTVEWFKAH
ncbi:MAG: SDR family oxidoreductase [Candidatus Aenigmatarchaeota archaeon]|nr:MAG: SDR family oxidoreductase [Candidatus Aenigmarchaeota archaeon]